MWGGTANCCSTRRLYGTFQSTHPVWGGTNQLGHYINPGLISIHPPRVGWDCFRPQNRRLPALFQSTHPVWGGTSCFAMPVLSMPKFQSTHPVWGGTSSGVRSLARVPDFNPPTPCGVGHIFGTVKRGNFEISIHPPRVGWDPLLPFRGASMSAISIHPPRVGWDSLSTIPERWEVNFNPPTPCGVGL